MKIAIIEDEIRIRDGLRKLIQKASNGYEVVGEAENGEEGFYLIQKERPDVVITDIKMPVMDGLEMLKKLQEESIPVKAIVLSAYSEFAYAQQAIKLGVSEYILKPIAIGEITQSLKNMEFQLAQRHKQGQENPEVLRSLENICNSILIGNVVAEEELKSFLAAEYQIDTDDKFVLMPNYLGQAYEANHTEVEKEMKEWISGRTTFSGCILKIPQNSMVVLFLYNYQDVHALERWFSQKNSMQQRGQRPYKSCLGWIEFCGLNQFPASLATLQKYMDWNMVLGEGIIIDYPKVTQIHTIPLSYPIEMEKEMKAALCGLKLDEVRELIRKFENYFQRGELYSPKEIKESFVRFLWSMFNVAKEIDFTPLKSIEQQELLEKIMFAVTYDELAEIMMQVMARIAEQERKTESSYLIQRAKSMIHEFYHQGITLDEIAVQLSITPEYLGTQFYKEVGEHFSTYIRTFRVEKAKKLLIGSSLKLYQVAEQVGYLDPKYFSRVFRSVTGELPIEYRKRHK